MMKREQKKKEKKNRRRETQMGKKEKDRDRDRWDNQSLSKLMSVKVHVSEDEKHLVLSCVSDPK